MEKRKRNEMSALRIKIVFCASMKEDRKWVMLSNDEFLEKRTNF